MYIQRNYFIILKKRINAESMSFNLVLVQFYFYIWLWFSSLLMFWSFQVQKIFSEKCAKVFVDFLKYFPIKIFATVFAFHIFVPELHLIMK